jgi:hypothetical protein
MGSKKAKKGKTGSIPLSPENYIRQRARTLPFHECLITKNWKEIGEANILVSRKHVNGNLTFGIYLVDLYCLGIKETFYRFNASEMDYREAVEFIKSSEAGAENVEYKLVHNIIYGAESFADEYGFRPYKEFDRLTKFILDEDTDEVDWMDIEFGKNGKPFLIVPEDEDYSGLIRHLERTAGPGNYDFLYLDSQRNVVDSFEDDEQPGDPGIELEDMISWDDEDWKAFQQGKKLLSDDTIDYINNLLFYNSFSVEEIKGAENEVNEMFKFKVTDKDYSELPYYKSFSQDDNLSELIDLAVAAFSSSSPQNSFKMIKGLIKQYPDNPQLHSILATLYRLAGKTRQARDIIIYSFQRFPQYLFILTGYLDYLLDTKNIADFEKILNGRMSLSQLYPERDMFAEIEVFRFYQILVIYFALKGMLLKADRIFGKMQDYVPEDMSDNMENIEKYLMSLKNEYVFQLLEDEEKVEVIGKRIKKLTNT